MTVNTFKLIFACVVVIGCFAAIVTGDLDPTPGWTTIGTVVGYVLGNGINARHGLDVPGIIRPRPEGRRADDPPPLPAPHPD